LRHWSCEKRKSLFCKGRATTQYFEEKIILVSKTPHNHGPNVNAKELAHIRKSTKKLAKETTMNPSQIINSVTTDASPDVYAEMPTDVAIKKIIVRNRRDEGSSQASLQEFVVPEKMKNVKGNL
jgi:hypothetical protein